MGILGAAGKHMNEAVISAFFIFFNIGAHFESGAIGKSSFRDASNFDMEFKSRKKFQSGTRPVKA